MKKLYKLLAISWFTFCLILIPLVIYFNDTNPNDQGIWLKIQNDHYYFGYIGSYENDRSRD